MLALIRRDLLLYFRNYSGVIFSLMGAMISFVLYLVFLKNSIQANWKAVPGSGILLDQWLIGGTLAITGITTTLAGLTQIVADRESQVRQDLLQTDIGNTKLTVSYLAGASLIGLLMQAIMFVIMFGYFHVEDGLNVTGEQVGLLTTIMLLNAALSTAINAIVINFVKHMSSLSSLSAVVGTGAGFLVGGLIPIGTLPDFAQKLIKMTPGSYIASLNRQVLMNDKLADTFDGHLSMQHHFEKLLGVRIDWDGLLTRQETLNIVVVALVVATVLAIVPQLISGRQRRKLMA